MARSGIEWDWKVRSYEGDTFMLETVHHGEDSLNMELRAIEACGRRAEVYPLSERARALAVAGGGEGDHAE